MNLKRKLDELRAEYEDIEAEIEALEDPYSYEEQYRECLDDEPVFVCGTEYSASHVLETVDPIAYRCGLLDYVDSCLSDNREYDDLRCRLADLKAEIIDLEAKIAD